MYERSEFLDAIRNVRSSDRGICRTFERDLSALLDNELAERSARRTLAHLESCESCSEFFQAIRLQALAHRDLAVPGSLAKRLRRLRGQDFFEGMADSEIIRKLASALYQLGKAYALVATDGEYLLRVAEEPVEIDRFQHEDMAEVTRMAQGSGVGCMSLESLENAKDDHLATGRRLLKEALRLKPKFVEARLYLAFTCQVLGELESAAKEYREVFLRTDRLVNRAHAAIQLGMLYDEAGDHRRALRMYRWVVASGLVSRKPEFAFVLYNIAIEHVALNDLDAAAGMLRRVHREYPELWEKAKGWLQSSPEILARLQGDVASRSLLEEAEPAFFAA